MEDADFKSIMYIMLLIMVLIIFIFIWTSGINSRVTTLEQKNK